MFIVPIWWGCMATPGFVSDVIFYILIDKLVVTFFGVCPPVIVKIGTVFANNGFDPF